MKTKKEYPKITTILTLNSENKRILDLENMIGIKPSRVRNIEDWPEIMKNNEGLPKELQPCYEWNLIIKEEQCKSIKVPLEKLTKMMNGKEALLRELVKENGWDIGIVIIVDEYQTDKAELVLPLESIKLAHDLNCTISFDVYQY